MEKRRSFLRVLGIKLIAVALILVGLLLIAEAGFRPLIEEINEFECHERVSRIINDAVNAELENRDVSYSDLITLTTNSDSEVTSVQSNVVNINRLKTNIANRVDREIDRLSSINMEIPVGTLLGLQLLHGKGFKVGMSVQPLGSVNTAIISEFSDAGINQTLHRVVIEISVDVEALIPGFQTRVPVKTAIVAAETVIVGRIPNAYTHVITESSEFAGTLNDYGAISDDS